MHGFDLIRRCEIAERKTAARLFRHARTGAQLLALQNDDENKVFGISFATLPADSTGVAHILEHTVLCGSRKYPLKDPFVELLKGSLQTFLNAFTFPDKTCYPVASQNLQDFYNLLDVYLDTVFFPLLRRPSFDQEGWHFFPRPDDGALGFRGVVYNEMKGAYSSPDSVLEEAIFASLFPDTCYRHDSGGDPEAIPDLTHEQLVAFHRTYYHPSNARIYLYGDAPLEDCLARIAAYLDAFTPLAVEATVAVQRPFDRPVRTEKAYDAGEEQDLERKGLVTVNWVISDSKQPELALALRVLAHMLIGTPASPLRKALIDSGLGEELAGIGLEEHCRQTLFSTGLRGTDPDDAGAIEALVLETLAGLVRGGIHPHTVQAATNSVEFALRECNTGRFPRGLALMLESLTSWLYGGDPLAPLAFEEPLAAVKERAAGGRRYFEELIQRLLLDNAHRSTVILRPDPELAARRGAREAERLAGARAAMDDDALRAVEENARELVRMQETPDPPETRAAIPSLAKSDLEPKIKTVPLAITALDGTQVLLHDLFTNGIVYLDVGMNLRALPAQLVPYAGLFGHALVEIGTETEDFVTLNQRISRKTGGIHPSTLTSAVRDAGPGAAWLFLRGKAMTAQAHELLAILRDVLLTVRLDHRERFRQIVLEAKAGAEAELVPAGHSAVDARLRSRFNDADWAAEQIGGIGNLFFLRDLARRIDEDWPSVLADLEAVRACLVNRNALLCNVTLDGAAWSGFEPQLAEFVASLPAGAGACADWPLPDGPAREGLTLPAQVHYVGKAANLYQLGYRLHGSALVIVKYLYTTWMWERVRLKGGAYGGMCRFDNRSGVFCFVSYRDPNLLPTLEVYDQTAQFLRTVDLPDDELTRSIVGAVGDLDTYQLPDAKGYTSMVRHLVGDSDALRQRIRDEVLSTTAADFRAFADVLDGVRDKGLVAVLGPKASIDAVNAERAGWLEVTRVL